MVNDEVKYIKDNKKGLIEKQAESTYGIIFGHKEYIKYDACFARLHKRISEQEKSGKVKSSLQYILRQRVKETHFSNKLLIKDLNKIFGTYFRITLHLSGRKTARIINIKEIKKLPSPALKYAGYYMILVLLRAIDGEYFTAWNREYKKKKLTKWSDVIYHYYKTIGIWGHGINDNIGELGQQAKRRATPGNEKLYKNSIENFLKVLETAFGGDFDYKSTKKTKINYDSYQTRGQTPAFKYVENIIKQGGRK